MILVTGFGPFAGRRVNGSATVASLLSGELLDGLLVHGEVMDVTWVVREDFSSVEQVSEPAPEISLAKVATLVEEGESEAMVITARKYFTLRTLCTTTYMSWTC